MTRTILTLKTTAAFATLIVLGACGGGSSTNSLANTQDPNQVALEQPADVLTEVLSDLYDTRGIDQNYASEVAEILNSEGLDFVPANGSFDMIGTIALTDVESPGTGSAIGILDLAVSIDQGTFGGSASNFQKVQDNTNNIIGTYGGNIQMQGIANAEGITGTAIGTLTDLGQAYGIDAEIAGGFTQTQDASTAIYGLVSGAPDTITGAFAAVEY